MSCPEQTDLMDVVARKTSSLEGIARTIAVPNLHPARRLPTFPNLERTAVLAFTDTSVLSVPASGTMCLIVTRDPAFPLWQETTTTSAGAFFISGHAGFAMKASSPLDVTVQTEDNTFKTGIMAYKPYIVKKGVEYIPLGARTKDSGMRLGFEIKFAAGAATSGFIEFELEMLTGNGEVESLSFSNAVTMAAGLPVSLAMEVGLDYVGARFVKVLAAVSHDSTIEWVRMGCTTTPSTSTTTGALTTPVAATVTRMWPVGAPPDYVIAPQIWQAVRSTAVAALFTNVTSVMDKEGTVTAARLALSGGLGSGLGLSPLRPYDWAGFSAVHPRDRYFGAMEHGIYTYTLPDANSEKFVDCTMFIDNNPLTSTDTAVVNIDSMGYANCIQFADFDSSKVTNLALTLDRHIEFRTTSRLFPTDFARESLEAYHVSQMALNQMGVFMENPTHLALIAGMAAKAVRAAWPLIKPYAMPIAAEAVSRTAKWAKSKIAGSLAQSGLAPPAQNSRPQNVRVSRKTKKQRRKSKK